MNRFYLVTAYHSGPRAAEASARITLEALGNLEPTNCWYGASRIHSRVRVPVVAHEGDQIHDLCGGRFLVRPNSSTVRLANRPKVDPFEHSHGELPLPPEALEIPAAYAFNRKGRTDD